MKFPITDQFLYDLYSVLEDVGAIAHFVLRPYPTMRNSLPGPKNPVFEKYRKAKNKQKFNKLIYYLKRHNYIKVKNFQGKTAILLTKRGLDKAIKISFKFQNKERKKRKDGKWIMIIFDMPQNQKRARNLLREILINLGYKLFQQSVWVTPCDVSKKTEDLLQFYSLDRYVRIFLINEILGIKYVSTARNFGILPNLFDGFGQDLRV